MAFGDDGIRVTLLTPQGSLVTLPVVQTVTVDDHYLHSISEALDGPVATTFRPSYTVITIAGEDFLNPVDRAEFHRVLKELEKLSFVQMPGQEFAILRAECDGVEVFKYYVNEVGHFLNRRAEVKTRVYSVTFVGSEFPLAQNGYLLRGNPMRVPPPLTSGKWQV